MPLVPRGASGTWWTRWWDFADRDVQKVVDGFRQRSRARTHASPRAQAADDPRAAAPPIRP